MPETVKPPLEARSARHQTCVWESGFKNERTSMQAPLKIRAARAQFQVAWLKGVSPGELGA